MTQKVIVMKSKGIAVLLSLIIPGAGSMYAEKVGKGFGLLLGTILGYFMIVVPGVIMHIISMICAANDTQEYNEKLIAQVKD